MSPGEPASCCTLPNRLSVVATAATASRITLESTAHGEQVLVDGAPFAEYRTDNEHQPVVWPIVGPSEHAMTRSWPLGPRGEMEEVDHPHHESLWFSHGGVNGHDFWLNLTKLPLNERPRIVHREFLRSGVDGDVAVLKTANDWMGGDEKVLTDERTLAFGVLGASADAPRFIDFTIRLEPTSGPAVFTDTKEGTFGVRVPGPMKVDAKLGGGIVNSRGQNDGDAWGVPAEWVDYHGPLTPAEGDDAPVGGVVIMSHPESFQPACRWHVRNYGLFAANPFGVKHFPGGKGKDEPTTIEEGGALTLRYRVIFYAGAQDPATLAEWFDQFGQTSLNQYAAGE